MTKSQAKAAQNLMLACAHVGLDFEAALCLVAAWMKRQGIAITERNLRRVISRLK